ncbi:MAG: PepSY domain-containing protein [Christensenellaceae bacterium]|nr:PepSY domain-containing protein [Christensenellaceae bacterium]
MPEKKKSNKTIFRIIAAAAAFIFIATALVGLMTHRNNRAVAAVVSLDVNPGIEVGVNRNESVLYVTPLNEDARIVIGDMNLEGSSLDVAINALIGSMLKNGYINELANSILISVDGADTVENAALQDKLSHEINALLQANALNGAVLSQVVNGDDELKALAESYGITLGKAQLIRLITMNDSRYTFEGLVPLTINQLNLLCESTHMDINDVDFVGHASDAAYIGVDAAKRIVLDHAGISMSDVTHLECELDCDNGRMVYDVEIKAGGKEYDYKIDAENGSVLNYGSEIDDDLTPNPSQRPDPSQYIGEDAAKRIALNHASLKESDVTRLRVKLDEDDDRVIYEVKFHANGYEYDYEIDAANGKIVDYDKEWDDDATVNTAKPTSAPTTAAPATAAPTTSSPAPSAYIGKARAKQIALAHAGLTEDQVTGLSVEFDYDHGRAVYEVDFYANGYEYEYDIDARTGAIIDFDSEYDDDLNPRPTRQPEENGFIGEEAAKNISFIHAGIDAGSARHVMVELEREKGIMVYKVDFKAGDCEYEYEINAGTGEIIEFETESDD